MTTLAVLEQPIRPMRRPPPRDGIVSLFSSLAGKAGAAHYLLTDALGVGEDVEIMAADWTFDAIRAVGSQALTALCTGSLATLPGQPARIVSAWETSDRRVIDGDAAFAMEEFGHAELACLVLQIGPLRHAALFTTGRPGGLDASALARAQMEASHALSLMPERLARTTRLDPLSERERECLRWVSEGKTTEEIALILEVSANTVNSYVTHAIHKLAASNRAMAVASAIRNGII